MKPEAVQPITPTPSLGATAAPAPALPPANATTGGAVKSMGLAEFVALDTMLQAFLADGVLGPAEVQAYQAARTAFLGGEIAPPVAVETTKDPMVEAPAPVFVAPVTAESANTFEPISAALIASFAAAVAAERMTAGDDSNEAQAPPNRGGLAGALDAYRIALLEHDAHHQGAHAAGLAGLTGSNSHQVHFLPQLMIPHGLRVLSWAAFNREPTEPEQQAARQLMDGGDPASGTREIHGRIMHHAPDPAAMELRLVWPVPAPEGPSDS
ncbi:MAG: hypothetical protein ACK46X_11750 [Candidatus Sericytochromatia bacterium]